jgi:hypothetical protein
VIPGYETFVVDGTENKTYAPNFHPNIQPEFEIEFILDEFNMSANNSVT